MASQSPALGFASTDTEPLAGSPFSHREVAFVSDRVDDLPTLLAALRPDVDLVMLDSQADGLAQIAAYLNEHAGIRAVHVVSHGREGSVELGKLWLGSGNLADHADTLASIGQALAPGGDLLFYGCNLAAGEVGAGFVDQLARATGADVAASDDATGSTAFGGDWVLEAQHGHVSTPTAFVAPALDSYGGLLSVSDENFDSAGLITAVNATSQAVGTWTFSAASAVDVAVANANETVALLGGANDRVFIWNLDLNDGVANVSQFSFASTDGTNFDLNSFSLAASSNDGYGTYAQTMSVTISGWRDGAQVVAGETVDLRTSDSAGNITYTMAGTGTDNNGFQDFFHGYGQLSFGSAFDSVDEIRLAFGGTVTAEVDDIDITVASAAAISSATYNASTGVLSVTGSGMTTGDTIDPTKLTVTGSNGGTYTLTSGSVTASSATAFSITLNAADRVAVNGLWNYDGTTAVNGTTYNLSAASGWDATASAVADTTNGVTVSNVATPTITSATYDASTNVLVVTGTRLVGQPGAANDITVGNLRLRGEGGTTYTLTSGNVDVSSETSFSVTLNATDEAAVELLFNRNGTTSTDISTYTLSALDYWNTDVNDGGMADSNNLVTVSNVPVPAITSATYDASTGVLVVTGTGFTTRSGASNDIDVTKLSLSGEGGASYTLTTSNVDVTNGTSFSVTLNATDRAAVNLFMNRSGTSSTSGSTYNLAAAEDWARGADSAVTVADTTGNGVTATVPAPTITSATYDAGTGALVVTGTGFVSLAGAANDIDISKFTISGDSSAYTLTSSSVDVTSSTSFTVTLNSTDISALTSRLNKNGTSSVGANTYNLAAAEDWAAGAAAGVTVADLSGNGITVSNFVNAPSATIVVADNSLIVGETSLVTFTFNEAVSGFTNADLTIANGTLSAVSSSDGGTTFTATLTPTASIEDATNVITMDMTGVTGNVSSAAGIGTTDSNNYAIDTLRPTLASSITISDTALKIGDTATVTFTYTEAVTGFTIADVTVPSGSLSNLSSSDGGITWTATLTPSASTTDATNVLTLDYTGIADLSGNAGSGSATSGNYAVDTVRPALASAITISDTALKIGDTATVTFTFAEAVTGFTTADVTVANGVLSNLSTSDGGITWTATLTPDASVTDNSNVLTLDYTGIADLSGNAGSSTVDSGNYAIDTVRPALASSITISDTALKVGDTATVTFTFTEAVTGFTSADMTVPNGVLSNLSSSDGGITWTATLTPDASVTDSTNVLTLDCTGISDLSGNAGSGSANSGNYKVDTVRPTLASAITISDTALKIGDTATVTFTFAEAVVGFTLADLTVPSGTLSGLSTSDGGITWTATLTPAASTSDATNVLTLDYTGISDVNGNAGSGSANSGNYAVDTQRPTATIGLSDTAIVSGETAVVTITFSEAVSGFTNADLTVPNGTLSAVSSGDGGVTWTATYTPSNAVLDASNVITLDNTGVSDTAGNAGTGTTDSGNFTIDTTDNAAPVLASAVANGNTLVLTYSDANALNAVNIAPNAAFSVISGGQANAVTGVAVDGAARTVTLTLDTAVLQAEAVSVSYTDPTAGNDTNATQDLAGNDAASFVGQVVSNITGPDGTPPTATLTVADSDLSPGETTTVTISFDEPVADLTLADLSAGSGALSNLQQLNAKTWSAVLQPFVNANAAGNVVRLDATGIHDRSGNAGVGSYSSNSYGVRTLDPAASITLADTQLSAGETTQVTISFASAVSGLDLGDLSVQGGSLGGLGSSDGGLTWRATFTPTAGYSSASNVIVLNHAGITNAQGQPGSGSTSSGPFAVDTQAPSLTISSDKPVLGLGQSATLSFSFSETPSGFGAEDITVHGGSLSALAPTADPRVYIAQFTPSDARNSISVSGAGYSDLAGNRGSDASFSGPTLDTTAPVFDPAGSSPADDAGAVPVGSTLVLHFSEALSAGPSSLGSVSLRHMSDGTLVPAAITLDASGNLVIDPSADLAYDSDYAVAWDALSLKDAAGNAVAALVAGSSYNFHTAAAPTSGPDTQDGVPVSTVTTPNPDGSSTETVSTPPVPGTRPEDPNTPNATLADLVVAQAGDGTALLTVSLPVGVGVRSEATTGGNLTLRQQLVNATTAHESDPAALQALIDTGIDQYVPTVGDPAQVTVRTLTLQPGTGGVGSAPIVITGAQGLGEGSSEHPQRQEALVIDASNLPPGTVLQLDDVEFAIIIGPSRVVGGNGSNVVFGDGSSQFIVLGAADDQLHGGAGDDTVGSKGGNDTLYGDAGNDHLVGGIGNDTLDGGAGNDVLQGGPSDAGTWTIQLDAQGRILSRFETAEAALGGPASDSHIGPWTLPGQPQDSDDRLAYTYQSAQRLQDVAMLYRAATGALPSLDDLNGLSTSGLTSQQLAQAAYNHYAAGHVLPQAIELQVKALIETVWGAGTASDALIALGSDYLTHGGQWADALLYLARDAHSLQRSTDGQGNLNLAQPLVTSELGWNADAGNDVLRGGEGDDRLVGGRGSDVLDGGAGVDTAVFTGNVRDYHFHKATVNGVAQLVMQSYGGTDVDTLISIERWEIGSKTYAADSALAALPDNVDKPLADFLVELVGQSPAAPMDGMGG